MTDKAIIPIAGEGTRMKPLTPAVPKAMLPLVDETGRIRPAVHWIAAEAAAGGIERAALVVSPQQVDMVKGYFDSLPKTRCPLPGLEYIVQQTPLGFGDAVSLGEAFVDGQPFILLLGDHVRIAGPSGENAVKAISRAMEETGGNAMIAVQTVDGAQLESMGVAAGEPVGGDIAGLYRCTAFAEKPSRKFAAESLRTPGLSDNEYLAHAGVYAFTCAIFECIADVRKNRGGGEIELAAAQSLLLEANPGAYHLLLGDAEVFDIGTPPGYARAFVRKCDGGQQ